MTCHLAAIPPVPALRFDPPAAGPGRPVKVLHVLHSLQPAGAEVLACDLSADLAGRYDFCAVALDEGGALAEAMGRVADPVVILHRRPGLDWRCVRRLAHLYDRQAIDIVHAHQYTPMCYAVLAGLLSRRRPRVLFTEHGRHYPDRPRLKRRLANGLLLGRRLDHITAVGRYVKRALVVNEGLPARRIEVIYNGIRPERFARADLPDGAEVKKALGLPADRPVIMHVGGLRPVKDHGTAVEALARLHAQGWPAVLVCVGEGPMRRAIEQRAGQRGVGQSVKLLGWRDDVERLWPAADVAVNCSLSEGISVALLEAMAAGRPVVATDVGGNGEVVAPGRTGLLVERGDPGGLAGAMAVLLGDAAMRRRFGRAGRQRVIEHFHQQRMHAAYARCYDRLAARADCGRSAEGPAPVRAAA